MINLGLVGKNIAHSKSPDIYKRFLGKVSYELLDYQKENFIPSLRELFNRYELLGLNITAPYKGHFLDQVDVMSSIAEKLGAINCIKKKNGKFFSDNTDYFAVKHFLKEFYQQGYKQIVLLGNGNMAKLTLNIVDELSQFYDISCFHYYRNSKNNSIQKLNLKNHLPKEKTLVINSCSRGFQFDGILSRNCLFWDYNYSYFPHANKFENYIDGYELLLLQGKYSSKFFKDNN